MSSNFITLSEINCKCHFGYILKVRLAISSSLKEVAKHRITKEQKKKSQSKYLPRLEY